MLRDVFYFGSKPNAHPREQKANDLAHARSLSTTEHFWIVNDECDYRDFDWNFDFDFLPDEDVWMQEFNNAWPSTVSNDSGTWLCPRQDVETFVYRMDVEPVKLKSNWKILTPIDMSFDFSWRPDPHSPPYIYTWGNKYIPAEIQPTLEYHVEGATDRKYMGDVKVVPQWSLWKELIPVDKDTFDFTWRPDPREPAFIYVWGNKYNNAEREPTIEYHTPGATERKYMNDILAIPLADMSKYKEILPVESFDYSWRPDPLSPPFIYVFGNKWNDATVEDTLEYRVPGATERKYVTDVVAITKPEVERWNNMNDESFDYSWRPNPFSPPQIYQWEHNGPCYTVEGATDVVLMEYSIENSISKVNKYYIKTDITDLINEHLDEVFWALNPDLNYDSFDFDWKPDSENFRHINVFGNSENKNTQTYFVNGPMYKLGHKELNYVEDKQLELETNVSMFYVDRGLGRDRFDSLKERYPQLQRTRYLNSWVETIQRCCNKSETKLFWVLNSEIDYTEFKFDFYPSPWQMNMVHVFGTQWSHWGTTFLVNKETFEESTKYVKVIEHLNILNFVKSKRTKAVEKLYPTVLIDHENEHSMTGDYVVKYDTSYLNTFRELLKQLPDTREQYVWVISSICDYSGFDFTYICDPYAKEQLHVFPSNKEKFGDTFLVNVNKLRSLIDELTILEDYDKINFNNHQNVTRIPCPIIDVSDDTHCLSIQQEFKFPYAIFQTETTYDRGDRILNLWERDTKSIYVTSNGASTIVVPKEVREFVKKELYDYPYIKVSDKLSPSKPLDIVFFSNGEACADENYEHLIFLTAGLDNRVVRVDGVQGRVASQHAAANASETPWYFLVNAKLKVNDKFDFDWQPDRLQIPKHYIFRATNPVNGLEYGHMAMVANNKKLTLNTNPVGLDFTMDSEHEIVDINSGIAMYNSSAWDTWRTAFRETLKLKYYNEHNNDLEAKFRLSSWINMGDGEFGEFSTMGALDACRYYETVNGDFEQLRKSYDWAWLKEHYTKLHK
jgi:hypothetical protein